MTGAPAREAGSALNDGNAFGKRRLADLDVKPGQRVLVRSDLNVPLENGEVTDDARIRGALDAIRDLRDRGAAVIVELPPRQAQGPRPGHLVGAGGAPFGRAARHDREARAGSGRR